MKIYRNDDVEARRSSWLPPADPKLNRCPPDPDPCSDPDSDSDSDSDPCSDPDIRPGSGAFGYFASTTTGGNFAGGIIPFTFADPLNRNVELLTPNMQIRPKISGVYRIVYSVTTTVDATFFLQLSLNLLPVASSDIPILRGVNVNELFLNLSSKDALSLNLTGAVSLASGKNASLLLQLISA